MAIDDSRPSPDSVTELLDRVREGDTRASEVLLGVVYDELRGLAARRMSGEPDGHTLQPTALVHEAWMRLVGDGEVDFRNRAHFFASAALAMRRILVERARRVGRQKRGGGLVRTELEVGVAERSFDVVTLAEALEGLEELDPVKAQIVSLRFILGLSVEETAQALSISASKVKKDWAFAKAWLVARLEGPGA